MHVRHQKNQGGFTLVEILVSLALGLLIIGGAFTFFLGNLKTSSNMLSQSKLQQEIKSTADFIQRDLRRAGYKPYGSAATVSNIYTGKTNGTLSKENCVLYSYIDERGLLRVGGFLLDNNRLYMYTNKSTAITTCPADAATNSNWAVLTMDSNNKITVFEPSIEDDANRPLLRITIQGELNNDAKITFALEEQIVLQNMPTKTTANSGS
ncbi:prepilin-type N-terminal cleavage/methylation domain-containing protein [Chitinibacter bivalviorum]|uniref:Prepilin-type N-terminal cleavage/methylation domain-containing protein n=1 Tax=Chitinibacter bivalviorum TaxID=2739434 RepID=A0A7H9BGJ3_9NEIS|nr:prepilin-type N-terminal cleavage/methylation domain-containing protein [Chitinibacter bivalviorum]QLG87328.1 prepilin-type N-terminal cleavage/methylation domain-containing protein [Chitinibacter bivalviorum]